MSATTTSAKKRVEVERTVVISSQTFDRVVAALEAAVAHPDMQQFTRDVASSQTDADIERVVAEATGSLGLMEMARFNLGEVVRNGSVKSRRILRVLIGNPLVMKRMVEHVPAAGSYAPVTVLIDERPDGVHLSYDTMASYLAPYGNPKALEIARDLDEKIAHLLANAAA
jgi:hypothetical protein